MAPGNPLQKPAPATAEELDGTFDAPPLEGDGAAAQDQPAPVLAIAAEGAKQPGAGHADTSVGPRRAGSPGGPPGGSGLDRFDELLQGQGEILDLIATGASLDMALERIALLVERIARPAACSVHLLDPERKALGHGKAPSLPDDYLCLLHGPAVGPEAGAEPSPCHAAARRRERVAVANLETDARWPEFCRGALAEGLRAICAQPILDRRGEALGVLALHYKEPHQPDAGDQRIMDAMASLTAFGVESVGRERALESANERFVSLAASIPGVVYQRLVTPDGDIRYTYISEGARTSSGSRPEEVIADPQALFDCHGPEYRATFRERLLEASRKLEMWDVEAQIITRGGEEKWTHAIAGPTASPTARCCGTASSSTPRESRRRSSPPRPRHAARERSSSRAFRRALSFSIPTIGWSSATISISTSTRASGKLAVPGASYRDIARAEIRHGSDGGSDTPPDAMVFERLTNHERPESSAERRLPGNRWILIHERRTFDGSTAIVYSDVTDLKRREKELRAGQGSTGAHQYQAGEGQQPTRHRAEQHDPGALPHRRRAEDRAVQPALCRDLRLGAGSGRAGHHRPRPDDLQLRRGKQPPCGGQVVRRGKTEAGCEPRAMQLLSERLPMAGSSRSSTSRSTTAAPSKPSPT